MQGLLDKNNFAAVLVSHPLADRLPERGDHSPRPVRSGVQGPDRGASAAAGIDRRIFRLGLLGAMVRAISWYRPAARRRREHRAEIAEGRPSRISLRIVREPTRTGLRLSPYHRATCADVSGPDNRGFLKYVEERRRIGKPLFTTNRPALEPVKERTPSGRRSPSGWAVGARILKVTDVQPVTATASPLAAPEIVRGDDEAGIARRGRLALTPNKSVTGCPRTAKFGWTKNCKKLIRRLPSDLVVTATSALTSCNG